MGAFDNQRKALVEALLRQTQCVPARLSEVIRNVPADVWDWNIFDEAVQRREILFDGTFVYHTTLPAMDTTAMVYNIVDRDDGGFVRLGNVTTFFRLKLIRQCGVDTAIRVLMQMHEWTLEDAIEMICRYAIETAQLDPDLGVDGVIPRQDYLINELFGVNVLPQPYAEMIRDQLGAPTRNVERRKLENDVAMAEQRLSDAKEALEMFKG